MAFPSDAAGRLRHGGGDSRRSKSVIDVIPLSEPSFTEMQVAARHDELAGQYGAAAHTLDQALKLAPDSSDLLQDRAEIALRLKNFSDAEKLARQSWSLGPKLGTPVYPQLADHGRGALAGWRPSLCGARAGGYSNAARRGSITFERATSRSSVAPACPADGAARCHAMAGDRGRGSVVRFASGI
ncbi:MULTISPECIES: tetratricopeptide repeat protein [Rhodanobacter]|jgi:tetratricopeptide (TPR) repeat protein|uniref:tetratricopeptide repeat protein n=1 Tax=Rhodanobacter TaxID=75309 RepID=UPI000A9F73C1|nr:MULTISPECIES: tetratricopeptide repeat protein [Rhodanobacter]UJJ53412.1 tetratricopeptide repeat protein [Rhodanobacter thiooxydans]UJM88090.1 tetratricopeptide repeat protein [Rhodanobacter denitrificans]